MNRPATSTAVAGFDVEACRGQFAILERRLDGHPLVYLDSAASAQKPRAVLDAERAFLEHSNANVHRGVHRLAEEATCAYEHSRSRVAQFLGASDDSEVIFVRGATEGLNLAAWTLVAPRLEPGDEIVVSRLEHHSNLVPWQLVAAARGASLRVAEIDARGDLDLDSLASVLGPRTRAVALTHCSNTLGTVVPVARAAELVRSAAPEARLIVDGAQAAPHLPVDIAALGCDAYAFSAHKVYGPMGIGALWARRELLEAAPPWQGGGSMIGRVRIEGSTWAPPPQRFEAGTPNVAGAVGFAAAVDWLAALGRQAAAAHESELLEQARRGLAALPGVRVLGDPRERAAVVSFVVDGVHPHDLATLLDGEGIAIRAGHHCTQPLLDSLGLPATARASFAVHTTAAEIEALVAAVERSQAVFA